MELSIQKWGNSAAVRLPAELLVMLHASSGDQLSVERRSDRVMLRAKRPSCSLADLLKQCDLNAKEAADMAVWSNIKPVGREVG